MERGEKRDPQWLQHSRRQSQCTLERFRIVFNQTIKLNEAIHIIDIVLRQVDVHTHGVVEVVEQQQDKADQGQECQDRQQCHGNCFEPTLFLIPLIFGCRSVTLSLPHKKTIPITSVYIEYCQKPYQKTPLLSPVVFFKMLPVREQGCFVHPTVFLIADAMISNWQCFF